MMLIKCTSALRSAQKSSCSFPAHFVLTNAPQSRTASGFFSAASARCGVLSSCSFDDLTTPELSFDDLPYKDKDKDKDEDKDNDNEEDEIITNAHRLTPIMGAWQRPAQLPLRLCARFCQAMCAAFLARRSKPKHP